MNRKRWLLLSCFLLVAVVGLLVTLEDEAEVEQSANQPYWPPVSVVNPSSAAHDGVIVVPAEIKPRWNVMLKSQVSGEVLELSPKARAGESVKEGQWLLKVENSRYRAAVNEAKHVLASARLGLLQQQKKSDQARRDWKRSGIDRSPSDLTLNIPQLKVAKKAVEAAKTRLQSARKNLEYTVVRTPFDAAITQRIVSRGQTLSEGDELLHLIDTKVQEVSVSLSVQQWRRLSLDWKNPATLHNMNGEQVATAMIRQAGAFLDSETRMHRLFLTVENGAERRSLPGQYVEVRLPGLPAHNSLSIPASALTREGLVWFVDDEDRLRFFDAKVLFHNDTNVIVETPNKEELKHYPVSWRIATTPLASFLAGNRVEAIERGGH